MKLRAQIPVVATLLGVQLAVAAPGSAADKVTYYEDVAPIIQANCQSCHRPTGKNIGSLVAPMSLLTYEETRPWARAISNKVKAREMPPWFASEPKGVFSNERGLSDREIETIVKWVDAGAPAGDKSKAPPAAVSVEAESGGWSLGTPDLIVKMPQPFFVGDDAQDVQGTFHTKISEEMLPRDVTVRAYEFRVGTYIKGADTVHHMCGGIRPPGFVEDAADDAEGEGAAGLSLGCVAGGGEPNQLPEGFGLELKKGSTITMNMHYYKQPGPGTGYWNQAEVGFFFANGPIKHKVQSRSIGTTGFEIPPHHPKYRIGAASTLKKDTLMLAYWPHAHLRAISARYTATYPDGRQEVLLDVPRYDQSWQVTYKYREPKLLPKGTRVDVSMEYDNTASRGAKRQFNPNLTIRNGPRTQDEMMLGFISYVELEPGDARSTQQQN
jgi:mono/diheme cytochrome c family protein